MSQRIKNLIFGNSKVGRVPVNREPTSPSVTITFTDQVFPNLRPPHVVEGVVVSMEKLYFTDTGLTEYRFSMYETKR